MSILLFLESNIIYLFQVYPSDEDTYNNAMTQYLLVRSKFQEMFEQKHKRAIPLRPKNIWMLHAGRLAQDMGSLAVIDTQFGEQKNAHMKQFSQLASQTKNVLQTVANREKFFMAAHERNTIRLYGSPSRKVELSTASQEVKDAVNSCMTLPQNFDFYKNLILLDGAFHSNSKCGVMYGNPRDPLLGIIVIIAVYKPTNSIFFIVKVAQTQRVNHLGLNVIVNVKEEPLLLRSDQIVLSRPINTYERKDHNGTLRSYTAQFF